MIEQAAWLIQPIKGNRSKRLFGLPASLVKGEKIAQFRNKIASSSKTVSKIYYDLSPEVKKNLTNCINLNTIGA